MNAMLLFASPLIFLVGGLIIYFMPLDHERQRRR